MPHPRPDQEPKILQQQRERETNKNWEKKEREEGQQSPKPENARGDTGSKRPDRSTQ